MTEITRIIRNFLLIKQKYKENNNFLHNTTTKYRLVTSPDRLAGCKRKREKEEV